MPRPPNRSPVLGPRIPSLRRWLPILVALCASGTFAPAASGGSTRSLAAITDATTGLPDSSSVVALDACGTPTATRAACLSKVLAVRGTHTLVHPRLRRPSSPYRLRGRRAGSSGAAPASVVPVAVAPQPGTPAYLQQAYDLAYLSQSAGKGATIAIVVAFDAPNAEADLATYRAEFSLPPCTTANGCFEKVDRNGGTNYPSLPPPGADWEQEASLDVDAVSALCPNCRIVLVEAASDSVPDLAAAQAQAAQRGASVISDSWAVSRTDGRPEQTFTAAGPWTFPQITTVAATGDLGYLGAQTNDYPAALGDVVAASGTSLVPASTSGVSSPRNFDEYAWSGGGSGCALSVPKPAWQADTGCANRTYADLSADADPSTGMQVYDSDAGGWIVSGGTSEASPLIAAYYALIGSAAQGPAWAYEVSSLLNDPTIGSNGTCSVTYICTARPGYDGPTGVGSISGAVAAGAPGIGGPGPNDSYTQSTTAHTAQLHGGVYPNGADTTYWWEYGTTTAYGHRTPVKDIGWGDLPVSVSDALSGLQAGITYHYRLVAANSLGTEYGYDYTLATAPDAGSTTTQDSTTSTTPASPTTPLITPPTGGPPGTTGLPPAVGTLRVTGAGASTATMSTTVATGAAAAIYSLQYGTTPGIGQRVVGSLGASSTALRGTLHGLAPGQIYYARVVVSNAAGSAASPTIRFRTSPVTITRLAIRRGRLQAVLRCHGRAPCRVRLEARARSRLIAARTVIIRGNRSTTVPLTLSRAIVTSLSPGLGRRPPVKLSVLSSWNGYPATVTATV